MEAAAALGNSSSSSSWTMTEERDIFRDLAGTELALRRDGARDENKEDVLEIVEDGLTETVEAGLVEVDPCKASRVERFNSELLIRSCPGTVKVNISRVGGTEPLALRTEGGRLVAREVGRDGGTDALLGPATALHSLLAV
jgi:hypothetical protein